MKKSRGIISLILVAAVVSCEMERKRVECAIMIKAALADMQDGE